MSARSLSQIVVLALILLGILFVGTRFNARKQTQLALADSLWRLKYDVEFEADPQVGEQDEPSLVRLGKPHSMAFLEVTNEYVTDSNPSLDREDWESSLSGNREFRFRTKHAGKYDLTAEYNIRLRADQGWQDRRMLESLTPSRKSRYTRSESDFPVQHPSIAKVLQEMPDQELTESEKLQWIYDFCVNALKPAAASDEGDDLIWSLAQMQTSSLGRAKAFVTLCRAVDIPARLVVGFELRQNADARPHVWTEVHRSNQWIPFDPVNGYSRVMPPGYVPIRRGGDKAIQGTDIKNVVEKYSILRLPPKPEVLQAEAKSFSHVFDLTRLPLHMHETMSLMLLLPLGALITAVFRNIVGLRTLGTFAPALLAMSFIHAAWGTGLVMLLVIVVAGLVGRSMLERLHLLMVPRLSIVLTTIILCVVFTVSLLNYLWPGESAGTVLIPLVILTILIERFYVVSEEDSPGFAVQLVLGTVVVAAFCYLLLRWEDVGELVLVYPEIHLVTIALFVLIGRYSGYRLTELWRFRDLVKEEKSDTGSPTSA